MTQTETIVDGYFDVWNESDSARRRAKITSVWSADANYVDPMFAAHAVSELDTLVSGLNQQYPSHYFRCVGQPDMHHDRARWSWEFLSPDGTLLMAGVDFAILSADGKLQDVTGFFEPRPS